MNTPKTRAVNETEASKSVAVSGSWRHFIVDFIYLENYS